MNTNMNTDINTNMGATYPMATTATATAGAVMHDGGMNERMEATHDDIHPMSPEEPAQRRLGDDDHGHTMPMGPTGDHPAAMEPMAMNTMPGHADEHAPMHKERRGSFKDKVKNVFESLKHPRGEEGKVHRLRRMSSGGARYAGMETHAGVEGAKEK